MGIISPSKTGPHEVMQEDGHTGNVLAGLGFGLQDDKHIRIGILAGFITSIETVKQDPR